MKRPARAARQEQIEAAAYRIIAEHGYVGTSMLSIAKEAQASNETLYRWYGDKKGLFVAMVARNAEEVRALLEAELTIERPFQAKLQALGPKLLALLLGPRAVALNRAAAADASGELGTAIAETGRNTIMPLVVSVFAAAGKCASFSGYSAEEASEIYLSLLVGDLQIRRAIGAMDPLSKSELSRRSKNALTMLLKVLDPNT